MIKNKIWKCQSGLYIRTSDIGYISACEFQDEDGLYNKLKKDSDIGEASIFIKRRSDNKLIIDSISFAEDFNLSSLGISDNNYYGNYNIFIDVFVRQFFEYFDNKE